MVKAKKKVVKPKKVAKKVVKKVGTKKPVVSATEQVLKIIKMHKKGVGTVKIKQMTQFNQKKIWDAIYRLKKRNKVESAKKGLYVTI